MTLLDPQERSALGQQTATEVKGSAAEAPQTLFESSWRDFVFAEVWTRPGLDRRARYLIAMAGASTADTAADVIDGYVRGALVNQELTLSELREAAMHFAIYGGWSRASILDAAITRVATELGLPAADTPPLRAEPWDPAQRHQDAADAFVDAMKFGGPPPISPFFDAGLLNFVFAEVWTRPGLDQRSRRWLSLVGVADSTADVPVRTHVYSAMASGNASYDEMNEFILQYAIHSGWHRASVMQNVVFEMSKKLQDGLTWDGKPLPKQ